MKQEYLHILPCKKRPSPCAENCDRQYRLKAGSNLIYRNSGRLYFPFQSQLIFRLLLTLGLEIRDTRH